MRVNTRYRPRMYLVELCTLYLLAYQVRITVGASSTSGVMSLVFTLMPGESYRKWLQSLLLYLCYVFQVLINSLVCWLVPHHIQQLWTPLTWYWTCSFFMAASTLASMNGWTSSMKCCGQQGEQNNQHQVNKVQTLVQMFYSPSFATWKAERQMIWL